MRILVADRNVFKGRGTANLCWPHATSVTSCFPRPSPGFMPSTFAAFGPALRSQARRSCFCGYKFRFDGRAQAIEMRQGDIARAVLVKYGAEDLKQMDTPMKVGAPPLEPWDGTASDRETPEFAFFCGRHHETHEVEKIKSFEVRQILT